MVMPPDLQFVVVSPQTLVDPPDDRRNSSGS
jgi:hypothetical protein